MGQVLHGSATTTEAIAPFSYSQMRRAALLGWVVFGHWPDASPFAGAHQLSCQLQHPDEP